ncbi:MAG: endonuclease domain-containing protein [Dehalococcoidales bacterium]
MNKINHYNGNLKKYSQNLRSRPTDAERKLWSKLRLKQLLGYQFYRQRVIGNYIVDFCSPALKLIIEVDGSQHYTDKGNRTDLIRDHYLRYCGFNVLRYNDYEVLTNTDGIVENILENMNKSSILP